MIEIWQLKTYPYGYLTSFINYFDLISLGLNMAYLVGNINELDPEINRIISSLAVLVMWLKFLFYLRLFAPYAALIRMVVEICKDISVFAVLFILAVVGFGNAYYILSLNMPTDNRKEMAGTNFFQALIYSYRNGLGDFNTNHFNETDISILLWFIFVSQTVLIQIVLLNLLIAIMGDTFNKVTEKKEESKLREMC